MAISTKKVLHDKKTEKGLAEILTKLGGEPSPTDCTCDLIDKIGDALEGGLPSGGNGGGSDLQTKLTFNLDENNEIIVENGDIELIAESGNNQTIGDFVSVVLTYEQFTSLTAGLYYFGNGKNDGFNYMLNIGLSNNSEEPTPIIINSVFNSISGRDTILATPLFMGDGLVIVLYITRTSYSTETNITDSEKHCWLGKCIMRKVN